MVNPRDIAGERRRRRRKKLLKAIPAILCIWPSQKFVLVQLCFRHMLFSGAQRKILIAVVGKAQVNAVNLLAVTEAVYATLLLLLR